MLPDRYLAELAGSVDHLGTLARQPEDGLACAVPACPGWALEQLFGHLGSIERWAAAVVREGTFVKEPAPPAEGAAVWFLEGTAPFLETMTALDPEKPCWDFGPPPHTARFWLRRQAHEHSIHLIDACQALGLEIPAMGDDFMLDGVDEVLAMFAPRQLRLGRMPGPDKAVTFQVPGAASWTLGPGSAVASISAPLPVMYLGLWGRSSLEDAALIDGDATAALRVLRGPLTP
ncbi:maleylpyruvate isomerase family mycothiol-dependent enzyme [Arthrobacter sp. ok362]|uniref:maleylpyruvate isomerase family mycothiol-dependent enzyme n=1 Tax=Arthrobacter sp. ok362 TaxID=1761745 RepID=UPI00087F4F00|nr:maleylpyruvate isomerase family mycothiol-dependent enzyme [Arthrobacter sp. ok362]SDL66019.1 TIGR03083 family protein [Arthrobacter sp. ok362]